jgi:magnesium and cobalt transporter
MNEEPASRNQPQRSWLERLSQIILREPQDRQQLIELLRDAEHRHLLDADALDMIEGVLEVSEIQVRDIMVPRSQMVVVEIASSLEELLPMIIESGHSRFPVTGENRDEVMGILFAKDLLPYSLLSNKQSDFDLSRVLRRPEFVPESKRLDVLLKEFRRSRNHMAIVVDEYGGVAGLITIEDVLEQIVGEIEDEHDIAEAASITKISDGRYTVQALTPIEEFNTFFNCELSDEEFDTIGGLVTHQLGHLPKCDEAVNIDGFRFRVLHSDNRRVQLLETVFEEPVEQQQVG